MPDVVDRETRSRMMAGIQSRNTRPELAVRRGLHAHGYRYRLHVRSLPGKPDIVLPKFKAVIFVNGCFWHGHNCALFKWPSSNVDFWRNKLIRNREVDLQAQRALLRAGWRILTIWECCLKGPNRRDEDAIIASVERWLAIGTRQATLRGRASRARSMA